jgi:diguanylate cyclase
MFPEQQHDIATTGRLHGDLRKAIWGDELEIHYQPKCDLARGEIVGFEALVRWTHERYGRVPPDRFIDCAERFGLIDDLGWIVLDGACRQLAAWRASGRPAWTIAVNVSTTQLATGLFVSDALDAVERHGLHPSDLVIEITESSAMKHAALCVSSLHSLAAHGFRISLDDFGTGFSSLGRLKSLPVHEVKIDKRFVQDIEHDETDVAIVSAIIAMCRALGIRVVAEGIETPGQQEALKALGCDVGQGYFIAAPDAPEPMIDLIDRWVPPRPSPGVI